MADDNVVIIEGAVKFREGKKWKSRWCTLRKLSPAADCVHLECGRVAAGGAGARPGPPLLAARLAGFACALAGFTLDGAGHTLALLTRDDTYTLAFDEPEILLRWQVKVSSHLGSSVEHAVRVLAAGGDVTENTDGKKRVDVTRRGDVTQTATRLVVGRALVLAGGNPPKALVVWDFHHLRRYGVCAGRVVLQGGARAGSGEGVWRLAADAPRDLVRDLQRAVRAHCRGHARVAELDSPGSCRASSRSESRLSELGALELPPAPSPPSPRLPRCASCLTTLVAPQLPSLPLSLPPPLPRVSRFPRSLSAALRPFAWGPTVQPSDPTQHYDSPRLRSEDFAQQIDEYYDTPKRLKDCLEGKNLGSLPKSKTTDSLILKKNCGCLLRVGRGQKEALVVETEETVGDVRCACQKVSEWARWVRLPYCRKSQTNKENSVPADDRTVLYATVDFSRKIRRRALFGDGASETASFGVMSKSLDTSHYSIAKPLPNYENLKFAQSLEYYENSKDVIGRFNSLRCNVETRNPSCREQYVAMCPVRAPPAGDAAMLPVSGPARSASQPELLVAETLAAELLAAESLAATRPRRARSHSAESARAPERRDVTSSSETLRARGVAVPRRDPARDSSSSGDSGVCVRDPARDSSSSGDSGVCVRDLARRGTGTTDTSSSAEAELPVVIRAGLGEFHSSSSGASDMSDYVETLSLCSSHSSEAPLNVRSRLATAALRPRSGAEYARPRRLQ